MGAKIAGQVDEAAGFKTQCFGSAEEFLESADDFLGPRLSF